MKKLTCAECRGPMTHDGKGNPPVVCPACMCALADAFWATMGRAPERQVSQEEVAELLGRHEHGTG